MIKQFDIQLSSREFLNSTYDIKYESLKSIIYESSDIKITYNNNVQNFLGGKWRLAKKEAPYTLYYAHSGVEPTLPLSGWHDIEMNRFDGVFTILVIDYPTPTPSLTITPTPTPTLTLTPTTSVDVIDIYVAPLSHNELTETVVVYARPTITHVTPSVVSPDDVYRVLLTGYSMQYTTSVFLSSGTQSMGESVYNSWVGYSPISGVKIDYEVISENEIIVTIPVIGVETDVDIIIANTAGYGKLTPTYDNVSAKWSSENLQHQLISVRR